jgi:PAS domain S-box-containing protein
LNFNIPPKQFINLKSNTFDFESLFELSPDLMCIAGYDGYFKKINSSVVKTLGYTFEELYNKPINNFVCQEDILKTSSIRDKLTKYHTIINFENRYITKTGEIVWLSWTAKASEKEKIVFAVAKNITDKKREEFERIKHISNLSIKNKTYQKLTYTTSHDLRAPVDNVLALLQFINLAELGEENKILINHLGTATAQLKSKLSNYIDNLSKSQETIVKIELIDLKKCLTNVAFSIRNLLEISNVSIKSNFSESKNVMFNVSYLESILLNLISNSVKYARENVSPEISIYTKIENNQTKLFIEDNGLGFDTKKSKDKIFKLHQTFHENKDSKGIGLYLVHMHVTSLGGSIEVESNVNKGTKFSITFNEDLKESSF